MRASPRPSDVRHRLGRNAAVDQRDRAIVYALAAAMIILFPDEAVLMHHRPMIPRSIAVL
jgi:hypothetical protein